MTDRAATPQPAAYPTALLSLLALGIVFGDIGTSPLYAIRIAFLEDTGLEPSPGNVLGVLSLVFWSLILVVSIKYLAVVLRANNRGEGGVLALLALVQAKPPRNGPPRRRGRHVLVILGLFGAALLYGDSTLTPAISVLSAVEGLEVATPALQPLVLPISVGVLVSLFAFQPRGTAAIGKVFGPVTLLWFLVLAALGIRGILQAPGILAALSPLPAVQFFVHNGLGGFLVLGAVFLVVTGGEAIYADMGHFGARAIRLAWFVVVLPALLLNYFGQGALLLADPSAASNPFYLLSPRWALYPLVALATAATIIASQAVISAAYSLTRQAIHLGYLPRMHIDHTSPAMSGQVYMPVINWVLLVATIALVLEFGNSEHVAGAYGVAITTTMVITTLLLYALARDRWGWSRLAAALLVGPLLLVDVAFWMAVIPKVPYGGWFPLAVAFAVAVIMTTWSRGRHVLGQRLQKGLLPFDEFVRSIAEKPPPRVPGTGVFLTGHPAVVPAALQRILQHTKVLHERVLLITVVWRDVAYVPQDERFVLTDLGMGFHRIVASYGFMETPNVPELLERARLLGLQVDIRDTTYFLGRERPVAVGGPGGMPAWRVRLYAILVRNERHATAFFGIPPERVVEVGGQIRI